MRNFTSEDIKDLLESPRQSIVKEWEEFYQNQLNSLGQQANEGEPFAKRFLSDLGSVDFQVNQLIENNKVLSDYDYSIKQLDKELKTLESFLEDSETNNSINKYDNFESNLIELIRNTNDISILEKYSNDNTIIYCEDYDVPLKIFVAQNDNCPLNLIELLSKDQNYLVRESIIDNKNCSMEIIERLSQDNNSEVSIKAKLYLIKETSDVNVLEELSKNEEWYIRAAVADNESTPSYILESLSKDEDNTVKYSVARNPNSSKEILSELALDNDEYISSKAMEKLDTLNIDLKETIKQASNYSSNVDESTNTSKNNHKNKH